MQLKTQKFSSGFTIIEVLVVMLILTISSIGIVGLQIRAQTYNYAAYFSSQATFLSNDLIERIRINTDTTTGNKNGDDGAYAFPKDGLTTDQGPGGSDNIDTTCDQRPANTSKPDCHLDNADHLVHYDLNNWFNQVRETLPLGKARIVWDGINKIYTITIKWKKIPQTISYDGEATWELQL